MAVTQYIGARYVPLFADPIDWDSTKHYEPLTIVYHQGNSFTSKQFVPTGIDIANGDYWVPTGNYNAQVEQYRREVRAFDGRITANAQAIADEVTARMSEDTTIRGLITDLRVNLEGEVSARETADTQIRTDFAAADTQIRTDFAAADTQIRTDFAAADTQIRTDIKNVAAGQKALGDRVFALEYYKKYENNPIYYGADPTGVKDSSAAINDCINACKGQTIVFSTGKYKLNAPIKTPYASRVSIDFNGSLLTYSGTSTPAAIMIGYSDNPSAEQIKNGSSPYKASYFKNLTLETPSACTYAIEINTHYMNAKFDNIHVNTATNGIRIGENATNLYPSDFLFINSFVNCSTNATTYTGITVNGTDNRFEQMRVYGFAVYFDLNAHANWFSYIHTLGTNENSRNGISYNTHGSVNWFNNIYNDTVRTCIKVNGRYSEINVNTAFDYAWTDIDNRCFIDCSAMTELPDYIFVDGLTVSARDKRYNGIKIKSNNTNWVFPNIFNIKNVKIDNCNYTDAILPYDDIIRMGLKSSFIYFDDTGTNYYPIAALICGDTYKHVDFTLTCYSRKTYISIFREGDTIVNFNKSDVLADENPPHYELCFTKYNAKNTMMTANTYIIGVRVAGKPTFKLENIPEQASAVLVPIQSGNSVIANNFGAVTPTYKFEV